MTIALSVEVSTEYSAVTTLTIMGERDEHGMRTMYATADLRVPSNDCFSVWDVFVSVHHRGEGHGRRMMQAVIDYATERGRSLELFVRPWNEVAIGLYESLGFTITRSNDNSHHMVRPYQQETA